jgi:hypothetical protein
LKTKKKWFTRKREGGRGGGKGNEEGSTKNKIK